MRFAFSLVELSIVLVILGLLTGGILAGQSLIRGAELRGVVTESQKFQTAVASFRDKYFTIPGDMTTATKLWGIAKGATGNDNVCRDEPSSVATCNGDGNGGINTSTGAYEDLRFWQHLTNAGLIEGSYNGAGPNPNDAAPSSKMDRASYWFPWTYGTQAATTSQFAGTRGNIFELYKLSASFYSVNPQELWNIDTKLDDGMPNQGRIWSNKGDATYPCTTQFNQLSDTGATYNLSHSGVACYVQWLQAF